MKRMLVISLVFLALFCTAALAPAENGAYWVELPDELNVSLNENIQAFYGCPEGGRINISCSDPEAFQDLGTGYLTRGPYRSFRMKALGQYTLHFTGDGFSKDILINVKDAPTAIRLEQDVITLQVGQTAPLHFTMEGGAFYNALYAYDFNALSVDKTGDSYAVTGLKTGCYAVRFKNDLAACTVFVVDPCEGVSLCPEYDRGSVEYYLPIFMKNRQGNPVYARVEMIEGGDCAEIRYIENNVLVKGLNPGWVTLKAYGTDGSTDEARLRIYEGPTDLRVTLSADSVPAGGSITVSAEYLPEGSWYPLNIGVGSHCPDAEGLSGPVATVDGNTVTGIVPGTFELYVSSGSVSKRYSITVTDSDEALVFDRPQPYFNWREPYQLSVHTRAGRPVPAQYSATGSCVSVTPDGLLSATGINGVGYVTVQLENGLAYKYQVWSKAVPQWLAPEADVMTMPLDIISCEMCAIQSDITISAPATDLVLCSNDETVVKADGWRILPQAVGTATLTVWSRYADVSCSLIVNVTEPCGRLFVNGRPDNAEMDIAKDTTVDLPTVTDYWGNPVSVTWKVTYEAGAPSGKHVVSLVNGKRLKCNYGDGIAELRATSASGASLKLNVWPYIRTTTCSFRQSEYTVTTGSWVQVDFQYGVEGNAGILRPGDVTFTVTGDTDCVAVEHHFEYHVFTGLREGTVTLTAKLFNGKKVTAVIHVVTPDSCKNGHDPEWFVKTKPSDTRNGVRALRCSRCRVPLGQEEAIPCTGVLRFTRQDIYLTAEGGGQAALLQAALDGDCRQSFTYRSSDPDVALVVGDVVMGVSLGTATVTVTKGDCEPAVCRVHVIPVTALTLPAGVVTIEDGAFQGVTVTRIVLPGHVTSIGAYAFADCPRLMELAIPDSVTEIGENAFARDPFLTLTVTPGSYAEQYCIDHRLSYRYAGD